MKVITKCIFLFIFYNFNVNLCFSENRVDQQNFRANVRNFTCNAKYDSICIFNDVHLNETHPHFNPIHVKGLIDFGYPSSVYLMGDQNNSFHTLTSDLCNAFPNINDFKISEVGLVSLESDAFYNCKLLKDLDIHGNNVEHLPQNLLLKSLRLKNFSLRQNKIKQLPVGFFDTTKVLTFLMLNEPLMEKFVKLSTEPSTGDIKQLTLMKQLYIGENSITDLDISYVSRAFPNLQYFIICPVISLNDGLLPNNSKGLEVKQKQLNAYETHLGTCYQGTYKRSENESGFDENIPTFNCSSETYSAACNFENLHLNETHPHFRPRSKDDYNIHFLEVDRTNVIHTLTSDFCKAFPNLYTHRVEEVGLQVVQEDAYKSCIHLNYVALHGNQLKTLPGDIFKYNMLLDNFWAANNELTKLPDTLFDANPFMEVIYVKNNSLTEFTFLKRGKLLDLRSLYITGNNLSDSDKQELRQLGSKLNRIDTLEI
uniref:CSON007501 protein n=1 Tax=Culicoides sonorensis TaxID=179676 RepID=A0A336LBA6_CULSO